MAKKKNKRSLGKLCPHYKNTMRWCPHILEDGSCSQRNQRPGMCREKFLVKEDEEDDKELDEDYYVYFS